MSLKNEAKVSATEPIAETHAIVVTPQAGDFPTASPQNPAASPRALLSPTAASPSASSPSTSDENAKITLTWKDLVIEERSRETRLLDRVSGEISEGLIAIMGPSGSGKTTLLNCLACRMDKQLHLKEGELRLNGEPYTASKLKRFLGYVMQDDVHSPLLTVRESLQHVADTRLSHKYSSADRRKRVEELLFQMSLLHCADVRIGADNAGIAAGEKKRLTVAMELLTRPKILFLDERPPTWTALMRCNSSSRFVDSSWKPTWWSSARSTSRNSKCFACSNVSLCCEAARLCTTVALRTSERTVSG